MCGILNPLEVKNVSNIEDRIKEVRKDFNLTQTEFGKKLGIAGNTVTTYETGVRTPSDAIYISICREFNVNEEWLRTGVGEKYNDTTTTDYLYGKAMKKNNDFQIRLLNAILQLDDNELETIENIVEKLQKNKTPNQCLIA